MSQEPYINRIIDYVTHSPRRFALVVGSGALLATGLPLSATLLQAHNEPEMPTPLVQYEEAGESLSEVNTRLFLENTVPLIEVGNNLEKTVEEGLPTYAGVAQELLSERDEHRETMERLERDHDIPLLNDIYAAEMNSWRETYGSLKNKAHTASLIIAITLFSIGVLSYRRLTERNLLTRRDTFTEAPLKDMLGEPPSPN